LKKKKSVGLFEEIKIRRETTENSKDILEQFINISM
jgi:hypothetical protein